MQTCDISTINKLIYLLGLRIAWGGAQAAEYLLKLVQLKYPNFPTRVTVPQSTVSSLGR